MKAFIEDLPVPPKALSALAREDLVLPMKEYARQGHDAVHGGMNREFEMLWRGAFPVTEV